MPRCIRRRKNKGIASCALRIRANLRRSGSFCWARGERRRQRLLQTPGKGRIEYTSNLELENAHPDMGKTTIYKAFSCQPKQEPPVVGGGKFPISLCANCNRRTRDPLPKAQAAPWMVPGAPAWASKFSAVLLTVLCLAALRNERTWRQQ